MTQNVLVADGSSDANRNPELEQGDLGVHHGGGEKDQEEEVGGQDQTAHALDVGAESNASHHRTDTETALSESPSGNHDAISKDMDKLRIGQDYVSTEDKGKIANTVQSTLVAGGMKISEDGVAGTGVPEGGVYDEVEIEDLEFVEEDSTFYYPCPCGDRFQITLDDLLDGEDIARCPSCSLLLRIIYDEETLEALAEKHGF